MYKNFRINLFLNYLFCKILFRAALIILFFGVKQIFPIPAPGDLDTTFNQEAGVGLQGSNIFNIDPAEVSSSCFGVAIKNSKIVVAGEVNIEGATRLALARLNQDGTLDTNFNGTGTKFIKIDAAELESEGLRPVVMDDGKIYVFGNVKFTSVVSGDLVKFAVVRFKENGDLDTDFNKDGVNGQPGTAIVEISGSDYARCFSGAIQKDGKIVLAGDVNISGQKYFAVARFNADGTLDEQGFNFLGAQGAQRGVALTLIDNNSGDHECYSVALDSITDGNEKIVVAGFTTDVTNIDNPVKKFGVARFNADGTLDQDFNAGGVLKGTKSITVENNADNTCYGIFLQTDGKIFLAGSTYDSVNQKFAAARLNYDGPIDENFNPGGVQKGTVTAQIDNGSYSIGTFGAIQTNGKLIVSGMSFGAESKVAIARFKENGELDDTFNPNGILPGTVSFKIDQSSQVNYNYSSKIQNDGKIVLVLSVISNQGVSKFAVARFIGDPVDPDPVVQDSVIVTAPKTKDPFTLRLIEKYGPMLIQTNNG